MKVITVTDPILVTQEGLVIESKYWTVGEQTGQKSKQRLTSRKF